MEEPYNKIPLWKRGLGGFRDKEFTFRNPPPTPFSEGGIIYPKQHALFTEEPYNFRNPPLEKGDGGGFKNMFPYNKNLKKYSGELRANMTDAERLLWSKIRGKQLKGSQFYRQKIIGDYIVDFYCSRAKLGVELDGGQHYSREGKRKDGKRDAYMEGLGLRVLRFSDREVFENLDGVINAIWEKL